LKENNRLIAITVVYCRKSLFNTF